MPTLLAILIVLLGASSASGEVIVFVSGRTMSVKAHRISGDTMTVSLAGGGEASFRAALVAEVQPDEVPEPAPLPLTAQAEPSALQPERPSFESRPFARLIERTALEHGVDPALVHAVVAAESNYQPTAVSGAGARGLMQVMPSTARGLGLRSARLLFDPESNLDVGVRYLKLLIGQFDGNLTNALAAYNAGPAAVRKYDGIPPFAETENYVRRVLSGFDPGSH